jgi:1,4-dihydroxy-2-naphthoyl-CoA hydrolase
MHPYPFIYHRVIRFQDTDAAGVVYFANLLSMCHEAYETWLGAIGVNVREFFSGQTVAIPIIHAAADFLQPMFCGETYAIHLTPVQLSESKFQISYAVFTTQDGATQAKQTDAEQPVGRAVTIHVCIAPQTRIRTALPIEVLRQLQPQTQQER